MAITELKYGRTSIPLEYDESRFKVLEPTGKAAPLNDAEIGLQLDWPIDSPRLEEIVKPGERVLIVVPDATRRSGCAQVVNLVVRRLIANGSLPGEINIIFATGIHRRVTADEKQDLVTPFIAQRIKLVDHDAYDTIRNFRVGETSGNIPVELNWMLTECDHVVIIGSVTFHYFAGFTGGRKLICPGLASAKTIEATHKLAFDCDARDRRSDVGTGILDDNPVHAAFVEAASKVSVSFAINTIVDDSGRIVSLFCGDWLTSHLRACEDFAAGHTISLAEKREVIIASCGGHPLDINMIQAQKALDAASKASIDGGAIVLLAECEDGLGREDFLAWFDSADSQALAERLCERYQVNGQTAWNLLRKAERFEIKVVTSLSDEITGKMRIHKIRSDSIGEFANIKSGYILPAASRILVRHDL